MGNNQQQEEWAWIQGYESEYAVSSAGLIKSFKRDPAYLMKLRLTTNGYVKICLRRPPVEKKYYTVHRIVAQAFIPNPENKPCINHKDSNRLNNHISNLEWCTPKENTTHMIRNPDKNQFLGKKNPKTKLTEQQVLQIRDIAKKNPGTAYKIAKQFEISAVNVYEIINNKIWKDLKEEVQIGF